MRDSVKERMKVEQPDGAVGRSVRYNERINPSG
jgi:hypothetical protein